MSEQEQFNIANDPDFIIAIMDAEDGASSLQRYKFKTIGDRKRLLMKLEERGFQVIKKTNNRMPEQPIVQCCNTCVHLQVDNSPDQTGPSIWCGKGVFDGIGSKEEADALSEPLDCLHYQYE